MGKSWRKKTTLGGRSMTMGGTTHRGPLTTRADAFLRQFQEAYEHGHHLVAVVAALDVCERANLPLPSWLFKAVREIVVNGRSKADLKRYKQWLSDQMHLHRYNAVMKHRDQGVTLGKSYAAAAADSRGQSWRGTEDDMHQSWKRVKKTIPSHGGRYWHPQTSIDGIESIFKMHEILPRIMREGKRGPGLWPGWQSISWHPDDQK